MINILTIQGELYKVLSSTGYSVYDDVPDDAPYPFISIGYNQFLDDGTKTNDGFEIMQYIDIYSKYNGQKEIKEISQEVLKQIKNSDINIDNLYIDIKLKSLDIIKESYKGQSVEGSTNGTIYHSVLILKIKIKELNHESQ